MIDLNESFVSTYFLVLQFGVKVAQCLRVFWGEQSKIKNQTGIQGHITMLRLKSINIIPERTNFRYNCEPPLELGDRLPGHLLQFAASGWKHRYCSILLAYITITLSVWKYTQCKMLKDCSNHVALSKCLNLKYNLFDMCSVPSITLQSQSAFTTTHYIFGQNCLVINWSC